MYRKLIMSLTPILAVAAFAVIPTIAQGAVWEHCVKGKGAEEFKDSTCKTKAAGGGWIWQVIPEKPQIKEQVKTHGRLTLRLPSSGQKIKCAVSDKGHIWNEGGVGKDEITQFTNTQCIAEPTCSGVAIVAENLPWHSSLLQGPPITDEVTGIKITVHCGILISPFTGTLKPTISTENGTATFNGAESGELKNPEGLVGVVEGTDEVVQEVEQAAVRVHA